MERDVRPTCTSACEPLRVRRAVLPPERLLVEWGAEHRPLGQGLALEEEVLRGLEARYWVSKARCSGRQVQWSAVALHNDKLKDVT